MAKRVKLSAQTIAELAEFFNKRPTTQGAPSDPELMAWGKEIYKHGIPEKDVDSCKACHGKMGEGKGLNPRLAGQSISLQVDQLESYANGTIKYDEDMTELSKKMSKDEMEAVSAYMQSL